MACRFEVGLAPPDLSPWRAGEDGPPGFVSRRGGEPGPHVALLALMHGNEIAGAIALDRLLRAGFAPRRGRVSFGFANLAAFDRFDPERPTLSRQVEDDLNRVWDPALLAGPRRSLELDRAREMAPLLLAADVVIDLHSMLWPAPPLLLSGASAHGQALGMAIGGAPWVVWDDGHASGRRLIDHPAFGEPGRAALLFEGGSHWRPETLAATERFLAAALHHLGMAPPPAAPERPRAARVTHVVVARTHAFAFQQAWRSGDVVPRAGTLLALDGGREIRTPHDDCLLVMPNPGAAPGHTALRLARAE